MAAETLDPIKYEVFFNKLDQAINESKEVIRYLSGSVIVREGGESLCGFYLPTGEAVDVACGILMHFMNMTRCIRYMNDNEYASSDIGVYEGDQFMNNDAYLGGMHVPDTGIVAPFFYKGELLGFTAGISHTTEVGAIEPGGVPPSATEAFHDGLIVPVVKLVERGKIKRDVFNMILRGTRDPRTMELDTKARMAGNIRAHKRLTELADEFGVDFFKAATRQLVKDGEDFFRWKMKRLRPGTYRSRVYEDTLGGGREKLAVIQVEMEITKDGEMVMRIPVISPQAPCYNNTYLPAVEATLFYCLLTQVVYDGRWNSGMEKAISLEVLEHSRLNADANQSVAFATVGIGFALCAAITEAISRAYYASGIPEEVQAPGASHFMGPVPFGLDQFGRVFGNILLGTGISCGSGGMIGKDGIESNYHFYNPFQYIPDVEGEEMITPTLNLQCRKLPDSGGIGKWRGGSHSGSVHMIHKTENCFLQTMGCGGKVPGNQGLFGGYPCGKSNVDVILGSSIYDLIKEGKDLPQNVEDIQDISKKVEGDFRRWGSCVPSQSVKSGDMWSLIGSTGAGLGDPLERELSLVAEDLKNGFLTMEGANRIYGVIVKPDGLEIDIGKTEKVRAKRRKEKIEKGVPALKIDIEKTEKVRAKRRKERIEKGVPALKFVRKMIDKRKNKQLPQNATELVMETYDFCSTFRDEIKSEERWAEKGNGPLGKVTVKKEIFNLTPCLKIVEDAAGKSVTVCAHCGFGYCPAGDDPKLYSLIYERDPAQVYPGYLAPDKEWVVYREFYCPECGTQFEVDQCPEGMPIIPNISLTEYGRNPK